MKEILERNREAVREAGRRLVEIGAELAAGKIDEALARLETARQTYREWEERVRALEKKLGEKGLRTLND